MPKKLSIYITWGAILTVIILSAIARIHLASVPLERDEGEYAYCGQLLLQGFSPYEKAYTLKMPGIALFYAIIMMLFGESIYAIRLGLLMTNAATIVMVFLLGRKIFNSLTGVIAASFFALLSISPTVQGVFANAEHFALLPALAGLFLLFQGQDSERPWYFFFSGLLFGIAFIIKQHAIFFLIFGAIYILYYFWRRHEFDVKKISCFFAGSILPFAITAVTFLFSGVFAKFWFWTFTYARHYVSLKFFKLSYFVLTLFDVMGPLFLIWIASIGGIIALVLDKKIRDTRVFMTGLLLFSFACVFPGFYFRPHYFVFVLPVVAILAGAGIVSLCDGLLRQKPQVVKTRTSVFLSIAIFSLSFSGISNFLFNLSPNQACREVYGDMPFPETVEVAKYLKDISSKDDRIAVVGSEPEIYFYADRISATSYIYMFPLMEEHEFTIDMQLEMINQIELEDPAFLIYVNDPSAWMIAKNTYTLTYLWFDDYCSKYYDLIGIVDMIYPIKTIYRWGDSAEKYTPYSSSWIAIYQKKKNAKKTQEMNPEEIALKIKVLTQKGNDMVKRGSLREAIPYFNRAILLDPDNPEVYYNLGKAYQDKNVSKRAEKYFKKAHTLNYPQK
jgi:MFS family permease